MAAAAAGNGWTPYNSLTQAPTNLKEAIDWVLRVTGKDGKGLGDDECICGLAAAVTDLLQSVQLEYHGYEGEANGNGPQKERVTECLNGLFSLVQGLGGTAVVRTYVDQLAQVLSALVGWSKIDKCWGSGGCNDSSGYGYQHGNKPDCTYLQDVKHENKCGDCGCMKWEVKNPESEGTPLGRKCQRCKDAGSSRGCKCSGGSACQGAGKECKCAIEGKCCKCCCKSCVECQKDAKCSCIEQEKNILGIYEHKESYKSAYHIELVYQGHLGYEYLVWPKWSDRNTSKKRAIGAQILLGSVCLIWSGLTYMYWTGKYHKSSPRWNNHILDGSGLDDGTLSQWLQALGFPREMLNNHGPGNRWDAIIWDGLRGMLYLGFPNTGRWSDVHGHDNNANTFRDPAGMNYAGYIHTVDRGAFCSNATVFNKNANGARITDEQMHKCGALYKLYILSCAYFTGLQQKRSTQSNTPTTPRTIREILYWLSSLPYSPAYPLILKHGKDRLREVTKKSEENSNETPKLAFLQEKRPHPITVHEYNLFAHFQAVTQYCPLVLIGIQGGLHSTDSTTPAIHALYANTECSFTYPTVSIQAYNQVVHYIRALFYQLYFLRKQCAVKVALGGKWRECRYGKDVVSKGVISWMCLGCDPMEHDRKSRVEKVNGELGKVVSQGNSKELVKALKEVLQKIGDVVVQLGNAQELLERNEKDAIDGVKQKLGEANKKLEETKNGLNGELEKAKEKLDELTKNGSGKLKDAYWLTDAKDAIEKLTKNGGGNGILKDLETKLGEVVGGSGLDKAKDGEYDPGKNKISAAINGVCNALELFKKVVDGLKNKKLSNKETFKHVLALEVSLNEENILGDVIEKLLSICNSPKCPSCKSHSKKCGKRGEKKTCPTCLQPTTTGVPSPLQAFLEDRLPGFSCDVVRGTDNDDPTYPPAASHLGHCNGSGQCCPLPMGFRGQFYSGIRDCTGQRLYGILYFFSNENMMQSCVYTLVRVTAALSATTPQVLGDVFGFFRGGVGNKEEGKTPNGRDGTKCDHNGDPSDTSEENKEKYYCGWCASGLRDVVKEIEWIPKKDDDGGKYRGSVGKALIDIKGDKGTGITPLSSAGATTTSNLSRLTENCQYLSPLTGELYTAVSATFGGTYLSWVLYLSDALEGGLQSLSEAFHNIECRGCKGNCDPNKCKKGSHGSTAEGSKSTPLCNCQSIVSCTGVLPVLYRHGFSYGNPFNLEGYQQEKKDEGDYSIDDKGGKKHCHEFLDSLKKVIENAEKDKHDQHPLTNLLSQVGKLQYDIRLPWIFVLTVAWLVAVLYLAFGAIWPLDWTHMRSHWLRGGEHQWQCMWYKVMTGRKGVELVEYFGKT